MREEVQERHKWLARAVGRERLPNPVWDVIENAGLLDDLQSGEIKEGELIDITGRLLPYGDILEQVESAPEPGDKKPSIDPFQLGGYEEERAKALARYLELRVSAHPSVLSFRRERLKDAWLLGHEDAYRMVENPDLRAAHSGIPWARAGEVKASGFLEFFTREHDGLLRIGFSPGSDFEQLHEVSQELRRDVFPSWSEAEAAWVVVTGEVRKVPLPLDWEVISPPTAHLTHGTITLKVEPWVSSETVARAYQWLQGHILEKRPKALNQRNLRVVQFVMGELSKLISHEMKDEAAPPRLSWRKLMDRWNVANPGDAYTDERHFHRDFYRTANAVVRPYEATDLIDQSPGSPPEM